MNTQNSNFRFLFRRLNVKHDELEKKFREKLAGAETNKLIHIENT